MAYLTFNGKMVQSNNKYLSQIVVPPPPLITMSTSKVGTMDLRMQGSGTVNVTWAPAEVSTGTLSGSYTHFLHTFAGSGNITVDNVANITVFSDEYGDDITAVDIPASATNLQTIYLPSNLMTSFTIQNTWINLQNLNLNSNLIAGSLSIPATLTLLSALSIGSNQISSLTVPSGLTALSSLYAPSNANLSSVSIGSGLNNLSNLNLSSSPSLTSLTLPSGLTTLQFVYLSFSALTSFVIPADAGSIKTLNLLNNAITSSTDIDNILIKLDNSGQISGTVRVDGGTNAAPTGASATAISNLIGKGWGVFTN